MPGESSRIDELRRRVQTDPASIAFAQLAEECRRGGQLDEAVRVCRAGLAHHPGYLSARVTLGRALMALDQDTEAQAEFDAVLRAAPDNLVALKCLEEIRERQPASPPPVEAKQPTVAEQPLGTSVPAAADPIVASADPAESSASPVLGELEGWLAAIAADRAVRSVRR